MSLSLGRICHLMESALIGNKDDNLAVEVIKKGLDLRSNVKEGQTFWDDFMRICSNSKALGHLLGVDPVNIMRWREKINKYYKQVLADRKSDELNKNKRNHMINTGDNYQGTNVNPGQKNFSNDADSGMGNRM